MPILIKRIVKAPSATPTTNPPQIAGTTSRGAPGKPRPRIPPPPQYTRQEDRVLHEEQQVSRVEKMMMQGWRDPQSVSKLLGLTAFMCEDYMRRAQARWDIEGGQKKFNEYRGESLYRLRVIESRLWAKLDELDAKQKDGKPVPVATAELVTLTREIRETSRHRAEMLGLTKERIDRLMDTEDEQSLNFKRSADVFSRGSRVASELLDLVEQRIADERRAAREFKNVNTIEHEAPREDD